MHKWMQKLVFGAVSLAANFWPSLAPCYSAMAAGSRQKICAASLQNFQLLNPFLYAEHALKNFAKTTQYASFKTIR
jgi:hypothetical protein